MEQTIETTLPPSQEEVKEMPTVSCSLCERLSPVSANRCELRLVQVTPSSGMELRGVLSCLQDGHRWPILVRNDLILMTDTAMPLAVSADLGKLVPRGIVQDMEEAEQAHFMGAHKAAVVMCRRAMQLALIDKGIPDSPLGAMLDQAKKKGTLKDDRSYAIALGVKDYGGGGAHRPETFTDAQVRAVAFAAMSIINALYGTLASQ